MEERERGERERGREE